MGVPEPEEKYPLLLLYVQEDGKRSEFPHRVMFSDKGRGKEVIKGAATIITQWPAQITSCWLTAVILGTVFIVISLLLLMSTLNSIHHMHPRCAREVTNLQANNTIHLVKDGKHWNQRQLEILKFVAITYPDYDIHNVILETSMHKFKVKQKITTTPKLENKTEISFNYLNYPYLHKIFFNVPGILQENYRNAKRENLPKKTFTHAQNESKMVAVSYEEILKEHKNIKKQETTFKLYFTHTPLQYFWQDLSPELIIFAVHVHELWQKGGITFYLPENDNFQPNITNRHEIINKTSQNMTTNYDISRMKTLITNTRSRYAALREDLVSVDGQGLHMATKMTCHAFFGEALIRLKKDLGPVTVTDFIHHILNLFCGRGAVDSDYCKQH